MKMTGLELKQARQGLGLSQASAASNCGGRIESSAFTATDIQTAEASPNAQIANSTLNAAVERVFRAWLIDNQVPQ